MIDSRARDNSPLIEKASPKDRQAHKPWSHKPWSDSKAESSCRSFLHHSRLVSCYNQSEAVAKGYLECPLYADSIIHILLKNYFTLKLSHTNNI